MSVCLFVCVYCVPAAGANTNTVELIQQQAMGTQTETIMQRAKDRQSNECLLITTVKNRGLSSLVMIRIVQIVNFGSYYVPSVRLKTVICFKEKFPCCELY